MIKYSILILIIALRIIFHPSNTNNTSATLINPPLFTTSSKSNPQSNFLNIEEIANNDKIELTWTVNENADRIEIEKKLDNKHFVMSALVFGTDKSNTGQYKLSEKCRNVKNIF